MDKSTETDPEPSETGEPQPSEDGLPSRKRVVKSAGWYVAATFLTKGLGYITIPIFTRIMTPGEFGEFNAFAAMQVLLVAVLGLEAFQTINRARFDFKPDELPAYQFTAVTSTVILGGVLLTLMLLFPEVFEGITDLDRQYLVIMALYAMFFPVFNMFQAYQRVQYKYKLSAGLAFGVSLTATALAVTLVVALSDALMGRIVGQYVPFIVVGAVAYVFYGLAARRIEWRYFRYAVALCGPLIIATLGTQGLVFAGRIVVQQVGPLEDVAYIALGASVSNIALVLITALNNAFAPWLMDCLENDDINSAHAILRPFIYFMTALVVCVSFMAPEVVLILGGYEYLPTTLVVPSLMASALLSMLTMQFVFVQTYHKRIRLGGGLVFSAALLNVVLCVPAVQVWGFVAVGYVGFFVYLVLVGSQWLITRSIAPGVLPIALLGPPVLVTGLLMPLELALYSDGLEWIRYAFVVAAGVAALSFIVHVLQKRKKRKSARS